MNKIIIFTHIFLWLSLSSGLVILIYKYLKLKNKFIKLNKYLYSYLSSITSARYGNFNTKIKHGINEITIQLTKNTDALLESIKDRDKMLKEYIEKERQHQNIKQDFISGLAHDLKVPIIAQDNTYDLFLKGNFGEISQIQRKVIENLKISNSDLKNLVINLLDIQKLDIEEYNPDFKKTNLTELIKQIIEQNNSFLIIKEKKITFDYPKEDIFYNLDEQLIKRVLNNLISNAIYHSKNSDIIKIKLKQTKNNVEISVSDEGEGIDENELEFIFNKYYTSAKKYSNINIGLGLYIVNKIVKAHNGKIEAKNNDNKGATFTAYLPLN